MNHKLSITTATFFLLILDKILLSSCYDWFTSCNEKFRCGDIEADFPFIGGARPEGCGHPGLSLDCKKDNKVTITIKDVKYQVLGLNQSSKTLKLARTDFTDGICSPRYPNTSLDEALFEYSVGSTEITLVYGCTPDVNFLMPNSFKCRGSGERGFVLLGNPGGNGGGVCRSVVTARVEMSDADFRAEIFNVSALEKALKEGFGVNYKVDSQVCEACKESGGVCGYDIGLSQTTCYCADRMWVSGLKTCSSSTGTEAGSQLETPESKSEKKGDSSRTIGISVAGAFVLAIIIGGLIYMLIQRKKKKFAALAKSKSRDLSTPPSSKGNVAPSTNFSQTTPSLSSYNTTFSKSDIEKGSTYFGTQVFSYVELQEATDNFDPSRELGEGGFGTVYYGKLRDGREVAVKRLYENNFRRVEQFMNEVEILTRLQHHNLVKLYGCTSRRSRELLLVYEFIPNGTVSDHLHGKDSSSSIGALTWPVRLSIAIETADALSYLHRSDIIHRDVKTNNILLDGEFRVKVADFGLSKLFPTDVTHVSTAPQGTPGYVDPEYYQCYQLTTKSDVYSFGVVLTELISSLPAVDTSRHRHDINLANMAVNKVQNHLVSELVDPALGFDRDESVRKMVTDVAELAFRCLQQERDMRPTMEEVSAALREIRNQNFSRQKPDVVDIKSDDVGLLKHLPPPLSPDSVFVDKWISNSTTPNSC